MPLTRRRLLAAGSALAADAAPPRVRGRPAPDADPGGSASPPSGASPRDVPRETGTVPRRREGGGPRRARRGALDEHGLALRIRPGPQRAPHGARPPAQRPLRLRDARLRGRARPSRGRRRPDGRLAGGRGRRAAYSPRFSPGRSGSASRGRPTSTRLRACARATGAQLFDAASLFDGLRAVKSEAEKGFLREAAARMQTAIAATHRQPPRGHDGARGRRRPDRRAPAPRGPRRRARPVRRVGRPPARGAGRRAPREG